MGFYLTLGYNPSGDLDGAEVEHTVLINKADVRFVLFCLQSLETKLSDADRRALYAVRDAGS